MALKRYNISISVTIDDVAGLARFAERRRDRISKEPDGVDGRDAAYALTYLVSASDVVSAIAQFGSVHEIEIIWPPVDDGGSDSDGNGNGGDLDHIPMLGRKGNGVINRHHHGRFIKIKDIHIDVAANTLGMSATAKLYMDRFVKWQTMSKH